MNTIFSAYDIRGRAGDTLSTEQAWNVGKAFAEWLSDDGVVAVAQTSSADNAIIHDIVEGLLLQGRNVIDMGESDEQTAVGLLIDKKAIGAILVSHDDTDNLEVITMFDANGVNVTDENGLIEISQLVESGNLVPADEKGSVTTVKSE